MPNEHLQESSLSPCEQCAKCGARIPVALGVFLGVCKRCWREATA